MIEVFYMQITYKDSLRKYLADEEVTHNDDGLRKYMWHDMIDDELYDFFL